MSRSKMGNRAAFLTRYGASRRCRQEWRLCNKHQVTPVGAWGVKTRDSNDFRVHVYVQQLGVPQTMFAHVQEGEGYG